MYNLLVGTQDNFTPKLLDTSSIQKRNDSWYKRENTGVLPIRGTIQRYDNMLYSTTESITTQLNEILISGVNRIILDIDSPGGDSRGLFELVDFIHSIPIETIAYVENTCASAGYLIASACDTIIASPYSFLGSIGACVQIIEHTSDDVKITEYVSSNSPYKRLVPGDDHFDQQMQTRVDKVSDDFINTLVINRGRTKSHIESSFGQGDLLSATGALRVGMIDSVNIFKFLFTTTINTTTNNTQDTTNMNLEQLQTDHPSLIDQIKKTSFKDGFGAGQKNEITRISEIDSLALPGHEKLILECKNDTNCTPTMTAMKIIAAEKITKEVAAQNLTLSAVTQINTGDSSTISFENDPKLIEEFGSKEIYDAYMKHQENK